MKGIALVGPMGSGKTSLANLLVERGYVRLALADQVKRDAADMLSNRYGVGFLGREDVNRDKPVWRPFLQWLGTDWVRQHLGLDDYWIRRFLADATAVDAPVVCDDVRFLNEADALRAAGFRIVRVVRPDAERPTSGDPTHASEVEQDGIVCDDAVLNDGDLDQLAAAADRLAKEGKR